MTNKETPRISIKTSVSNFDYDLPEEEDLSGIELDGVCYLSRLSAMEEENAAISAQLKKNQAERSQSGLILREVRDLQKEQALLRAKSSTLTTSLLTAALLLAVVCTILASWVVNRLRDVPQDTVAWQEVMNATAPREFNIGDPVHWLHDTEGLAWTVSGVLRKDNSWRYRIESEDSIKWVFEHSLELLDISKEIGG